jgi:hypothetical protein
MRLAERTLGVVPTLEPVVAPRYMGDPGGYRPDEAVAGKSSEVFPGPATDPALSPANLPSAVEFSVSPRTSLTAPSAPPASEQRRPIAGEPENAPEASSKPATARRTSEEAGARVSDTQARSPSTEPLPPASDARVLPEALVRSKRAAAEGAEQAEKPGMGRVMLEASVMKHREPELVSPLRPHPPRPGGAEAVVPGPKKEPITVGGDAWEEAALDAPPSRHAGAVGPTREDADVSLLPRQPSTPRERGAADQSELRPSVPVTPPPVRVTIGRIEVRAVMPERSPEPAPTPAWKPPTLSLDEYLRGENRR